MMNDELLSEKIDLYLKGKLSGETLRDFESKLASDRELGELVHSHKIVHQIVYTKQLISLQSRIQSDLKKQSRWDQYKSFLWTGLILLATGTILYLTLQKESLPQTQNLSKPFSSIEEKENPISILPSRKREKTFSTTTTNSNLVNQENNTIILSDSADNVNAPQQNTRDESPKETVTNLISKEPSPDCSLLKAENVLFPTPSCIGEQNGKIKINPSAIQGGKSPFTYTIEKKELSSSDNEFLYLSPGTYTVLIRDANKCIVRKEIEIEEQTCRLKNVFAFTPELEKWEIPVKQNKHGSIKIFNRSGILVYSSEVSFEKENLWDGISSTGSMVETGYFMYQIHYSDGEEETGSVSIMHP